jgi:hypothetical protein
MSTIKQNKNFTQNLEEVVHKFEINAVRAPKSSLSQKITIILFIPKISQNFAKVPDFEPS